MRSGSRFASRQRGFTLIEIMVALLVFMLGALGIAMYTATSLRTTASNQVRASALKAASMAVEPVTYHTRHDCLKNMVTTFPLVVTSDSGKDSYSVSLASVNDGAQNTVATGTSTSTNVITVSSSWISPVTLTLRVPYAGLNGITTTLYPSYTIILQDYTVACNG